MIDRVGLLQSSEWLSNAEIADRARWALRSRQYGLPLEAGARESMDSAVGLLERALRATSAATPEARLEAALSSDAQALDFLPGLEDMGIIHGQDVPPPEILEAKLKKLIRTLQASQGDQVPPEKDLLEAIEVLSAVTRYSVEQLRIARDTFPFGTRIQFQ